MNINKATKRDRKRSKKNDMQTDSKSVFTIMNVQKDRAKKIKQQRKIKEMMKEI
jgi:hypothetical protein